jgi:hypothetical protein
MASARLAYSGPSACGALAETFFFKGFTSLALAAPAIVAIKSIAILKRKEAVLSVMRGKWVG